MQILYQLSHKGSTRILEWVAHPFSSDKLHDLMEILRVLKSGGKLLLVFEMLKSRNDPDRWKAVEERLHIDAVSREGIHEMLLRAGYQNIRTHVKSGTTWLCAVAEKE